MPDTYNMSPPPEITPEERRRRTADRLKTIWLRMAIGCRLDERGLTTPVGTGAALGLRPAEAIKLLTRHQWREGDVALLEAAAAQPGVLVPESARENWPS